MRWYMFLFCVFGCCGQLPNDCVWAVPDVPVPASSPVAVWVTDDTTDITEELTDETAPISLADFRLIDYFRSDPHCPPCFRWARDEEKHVTCKVDKWDTSAKPLGWITSVPTLRLLRYDRAAKEWIDLTVWRGYTAAKTINAEIDRQTKAAESQTLAAGLQNSQLNVRRSERDLRSWIHERYTPETELVRATVEPLSFAWEHLRNEHGFSAAQVNQLPLWMAAALHDAVHPALGKDGVVLSERLIGPYE
jgi:hypothetical protein